MVRTDDIERLLVSDPSLLAEVKPERIGDDRSSRSQDPLSSTAKALRQWPDQLAEEAYYGLLGDIVRAIEPHTEADPVALVLQVLTGFGSGGFNLRIDCSRSRSTFIRAVDSECAY